MTEKRSWENIFILPGPFFCMMAEPVVKFIPPTPSHVFGNFHTPPLHGGSGIRRASGQNRDISHRLSDIFYLLLNLSASCSSGKHLAVRAGQQCTAALHCHLLSQIPIHGNWGNHLGLSIGSRDHPESNRNIFEIL